MSSALCCHLLQLQTQSDSTLSQPPVPLDSFSHLLRFGTKQAEYQSEGRAAATQPSVSGI